MVIQTNEKEFKGKTLQEYLEWKYPTKEDKEGVKEISSLNINKAREETGIEEKLAGGELDLSEYVESKVIDIPGQKLTKLTLGKKPKLNKLYCSDNQLTNLDLSNCPNLTIIHCPYNQLTTIDFLKQLPHPEKITWLGLANNNIQSTNLEFLRPFVNLNSRLALGNDMPKKRYDNNIYNRFYGSLEPLKNMTKLPSLCIDGSDVEEGLEYLPTSIENRINCSPKLPNQKVAKIQDQLRPFNYDIEAWQLARPEKMLIARPELFTNSDSKDKWIQALKNKVEESKKELSETDLEKVKRITRLENKIQELETAKSAISQQTQTEFSTQDKSTQTDLTMEQIKQWEQENNKTWYQKIIEKYYKK